jgi:hypothetical protein
MSDFTLYWKSIIAPEQQEFLTKSDKLSAKELGELQNIIYRMRKQGKPAMDIISFLQRWNDKLSERWQAKRAFETEDKNIDTTIVLQDAKELDINKFRVLISPDACPECRSKTQNGRKVFSAKELSKGVGSRPPFHPNCYCVLLPQ